jgi:hypothetical protein
VLTRLGTTRTIPRCVPRLSTRTTPPSCGCNAALGESHPWSPSRATEAVPSCTRAAEAKPPAVECERGGDHARPRSQRLPGCWRSGWYPVPDSTRVGRIARRSALPIAGRAAKLPGLVQSLGDRSRGIAQASAPAVELLDRRDSAVGVPSVGRRKQSSPQTAARGWSTPSAAVSSPWLACRRSACTS